MPLVTLVVGARPNFMKICRMPAVLSERGLTPRVVHTGQHRSQAMAGVFFDQLGVHPDVTLNVTSREPARQIGETILSLSDEFERQRPDMVVVVGDVNSTLAAAVAANKARIPLAHVEAGLRSFDRRMPEELNRILTDQLADWFFVSEPSGQEHLLAEGRPSERILHVGNTMIDCLVAMRERIDASAVLEELGVDPKSYALLTAHRPETVDHPAELSQLVSILERLSTQRPVLFPLHPRTKDRLQAQGRFDEVTKIPGLRLLGPQGYLAFQKLMKSALFVVTDSGGIQEETTYYGVPCLTLRENTERPVTVDVGTSVLVGLDGDALAGHVAAIEAGTYKQGSVPDLWDGHATERIVDGLQRALS